MTEPRRQKLVAHLKTGALAESQFSGNRKRLKDTFTKGADQFFTGIVRTYTPIADGGEEQPEERKELPSTVKKELNWFKQYFLNAISEAMVRETTNTVAKADLVLFGRTFKDVPATALLNLESKVQSLMDDIIQKIPTRSSARNWAEHNPTDGSFVTADVDWKWRTEKRPYNHVKSPESAKHPAQVEVLYRDENIGKWQVQTFSGAIDVALKSVLIDRAQQALAAIKAAREEANLVTVVDAETEIGEHLYESIFEGVI